PSDLGLPADHRRAQPARGGLLGRAGRRSDARAGPGRGPAAGLQAHHRAGKEPVAAPDLLDRDFTTTVPGQRLVGDITYLRTGEGWLYLATVIDLATRMVVGWQLAAHMRTTLVTDALAMAIDSGHVAGDAIFHSDRGTQYTSAEFAAFTSRNGIRRSLGRTGVCWDNAAAESFFATLKNEMYYRQSFPT